MPRAQSIVLPPPTAISASASAARGRRRAGGDGLHRSVRTRAVEHERRPHVAQRLPHEVEHRRARHALAADDHRAGHVLVDEVRREPLAYRAQAAHDRAQRPTPPVLTHAGRPRHRALLCPHTKAAASSWTARLPAPRPGELPRCTADSSRTAFCSVASRPVLRIARRRERGTGSYDGRRGVKVRRKMLDNQSMTEPDFEPVEHLLRELWKRQATDLLITVGSPPLLRIDGALVPMDQPALDVDATERIVLAVLGGGSRRGVPGREGSRLLVRLARPRSVPRQRVPPAGRRDAGAAPHPLPHPDVRGAGPPPDHQAARASCPHGLVLITGPTGSGKSTTLASMIDAINSERACHILTIEDPIEYVHQHKRSAVNQREVGNRHELFRPSVAVGAARGPRRPPRRRDARPGDDRVHAHDGRDRSPRVRDAAHQRRGADARPDRRRVPRRAAGSRSGCSSPLRCRRSSRNASSRGSAPVESPRSKSSRQRTRPRTSSAKAARRNCATSSRRVRRMGCRRSSRRCRRWSRPT